MKKSLIEIQVGRIISFGGNEWRVLDIQDGKALLLSDKIIEQRTCHQLDICITWAECDLRNYLNGEFFDSLGEDKARIAETTVVTGNNPWFGTDGGAETNDRVFLLSIEDVVKYFGDSGQLKNPPDDIRPIDDDDSDQLKNYPNDTWFIDDEYNSTRVASDENGKALWWWLRSPGNGSRRVASVRGGGSINVRGSTSGAWSCGGVRPALWLNLQSDHQQGELDMIMTHTEKIEHLLACLIEECAEVQQAASKALRFGIDEKCENHPTSRQQLNLEINDLLGVIEMLLDEGILTETGSADAVKAKKEKVSKYLQHAAENKRRNSRT